MVSAGALETEWLPNEFPSRAIFNFQMLFSRILFSVDVSNKRHGKLVKIWRIQAISISTKKKTHLFPSTKQVYMGVSKSSGTPKSSILIGFSIINHPFWGTTIFGNTHINVASHMQNHTVCLSRIISDVLCKLSGVLVERLRGDEGFVTWNCLTTIGLLWDWYCFPTCLKKVKHHYTPEI